MTPADLAALDQILHAAAAEDLDAAVMRLAMAHTGTRSGALFLWDQAEKVLALDFHVVEGVTVTLPGAKLRRRKDGRPNGIAFWVLDHNETYRCPDTAADPNYARYFLDVASVLAVPIPYQDRAIGVLTVSSRQRDAFDAAAVAALEAVARAAAKFLRRVQLSRASKRDVGRPFVIKGLSPEWLEVERRIEKVSATEAPILIRGESGTGKDLVARAIHFNSARQARPFVVVNCAAIPETLLESTLFGHVRGAFTGATADKVGEFHKADGGTLFLDEIGELPMALQAKVLRAVEQGEVEPLGSNKPPGRVDVRLLCATHRDLPRMIREGRFREDLYFRIGVVALELPPLRRYKDNLEVLAAVFVQQAATRHRRPAPRIHPEAMRLLAAYEFPGNVRELRNVVEHAVILCDGVEIAPDDWPRTVLEQVRGASPVVAPLAPPAGVSPPPAPRGRAPSAFAPLRAQREAWLHPLEATYLRDLLAACDGNVRQAARTAGVDAVTFYRLMKRRGVTVRREASLAG